MVSSGNCNWNRFRAHWLHRMQCNRIEYWLWTVYSINVSVSHIHTHTHTKYSSYEQQRQFLNKGGGVQTNVADGMRIIYQNKLHTNGCYAVRWAFVLCSTCLAVGLFICRHEPMQWTNQYNTNKSYSRFSSHLTDDDSKYCVVFGIVHW